MAMESRGRRGRVSLNRWALSERADEADGPIPVVLSLLTVASGSKLVGDTATVGEGAPGLPGLTVRLLFS